MILTSKFWRPSFEQRRCLVRVVVLRAEGCKACDVALVCAQRPRSAPAVWDAFKLARSYAAEQMRIVQFGAEPLLRVAS